MEQLDESIEIDCELRQPLGQQSPERDWQGITGGLSDEALHWGHVIPIGRTLFWDVAMMANWAPDR
jgi:hypothetical protein